MSWTTLIGKATVPVSAEPGIPETAVVDALSSVIFRQWANRVGSEPQFLVKSVHVQSVDYFGRRVGFIKIKSDTWGPMKEAHPKPIPSICFLRGGASTVLVVLTAAETQQRYSVIVNQPRLPAGIFCFPEIAAGMLDDEMDACQVAVRELEEETGLLAEEKDLIDLTEFAYPKSTNGAFEAGTAGSMTNVQGVYSSPGGSDEFIRMFVLERTLPMQEIMALHGRKHGCASEDEQITLQVVQYDDLWRRCPESNVLATIFLYEKFCSQRLAHNSAPQ
jgi:hypothetical protein